MATVPKALTAPCATRLPMLLKADWAAMGTESRPIERISFLFGRRSSDTGRITGYFLNSRIAAKTAELNCAIAVAQAEPATPQRKTATNRISSSTFMPTETIRQ